ncbi:MAG TPA: MoaD/ThiS family protein [Gaiellaceae bacterium]|nr:MoaD/ThiS family protein [Gaiellaceae bacterium]
MTRVRIPAVLRPEVGGRRDVDVSGATLGEVLNALVETFPSLRERLLLDGAIQPFVNVYVDGEPAESLATRVEPHSTVLLLPAIAGGQ